MYNVLAITDTDEQGWQVWCSRTSRPVSAIFATKRVAQDERTKLNQRLVDECTRRVEPQVAWRDQQAQDRAEARIEVAERTTWALLNP